MQKISDPLLTVCPKCGQPTLVKMLTAAGFQLKGSGWYATDFKSKSPSSSPKEATGSGEKKAAEGGEKKAADGGGDKATPKASSGTPGTGTP